jgi:diacylglycerol O-acyltransferase
VPGSQVPLYFAGARLVTFFGGAGVADGMGLLHGVSSYVGQLILSVVSDREMLPDPGHYADLLEASFTELAAATGAAPHAAATPAPRTAAKATARTATARTATPRKSSPRKAAAASPRTPTKDRSSPRRRRTAPA